MLWGGKGLGWSGVTLLGDFSIEKEARKLEGQLESQRTDHSLPVMSQKTFTSRLPNRPGVCIYN